jgi:hypothetical protein
MLELQAPGMLDATSGFLVSSNTSNDVLGRLPDPNRPYREGVVNQGSERIF